MQKLDLNLAGKLAKFFILNPMTPLLATAIFLLGIVAVFFTPREENPQINVPAANVIVEYKGANPQEVNKIITEPLSRYIKEISGVKHVYGMSFYDYGVVSVRFKIGENKEDSYLKLYDRVMQNMDKMPANASQPLFKPIDIDEVPILTFALSSKSLSEQELYKVAQRMLSPLSSVKDVSKVGIIGGHKRQFNIYFNPSKLSLYNLDIKTIREKLEQENFSMSLGEIEGDEFSLRADFPALFSDISELKRMIIVIKDEKPVYLGDIARVEDGVNLQEKHSTSIKTKNLHYTPQVTLYVSKKRGSNAVFVSNDVLKEIEHLKTMLPKSVEIITTRDDGKKADEAVNLLIEHLLISIFIIVILLMIMLGWRESLIVSLTIPLILGITLFIGMLIGQTINRITLFALILALGLLVDDSIVVIENIHRHLSLKKQEIIQSIIYATNEIGGSTNIATIAVVLAFLPMLFVTGMMGPYMGPIPFNVPIAMISSLFIAYMLVPWLAFRILKKEHKEHTEVDFKESKFYKFYSKTMSSLIENKRKRFIFFGFTLTFFVISLLLPAFKIVSFKMLPGANKNTFNITIDLPTSKSIQETQKTLTCIGKKLENEKEIKDLEFFSGITGAADFNALLRGSFMKKGENIGEIRVNLKPYQTRDETSAQMVSRLRKKIAPCSSIAEANIKLVEDPPGPPVEATIVAEIYGDSANAREQLAQNIENIFKKTDSLVDIDVLMDKPVMKYEFKVIKEKAALSGISTSDIASSLAINGIVIGSTRLKNEKEQIDIYIRYEKDFKQDPNLLDRITVYSPLLKESVSLSQLVKINSVQQISYIKSKDIKPITQVVAEVDNRGSIYALLDVFSVLKSGALKDYEISYDGNPRLSLDVKDLKNNEKLKIVWGGEWELTFDVFRDLGNAFAGAILLIYLLLVAYYGVFSLPGIVASAVPFSFIGVLFGHALLDLFYPAYFTSTSMIGFIALSGVVIRNSLLLVDFMKELFVSGKNAEEAVIEGGATRFRPILLTALAIILASLVIIVDPVWQGLAISLIFGVMVSTVMTLFVVPLLYYRRIKKF